LIGNSVTRRFRALIFFISDERITVNEPIEADLPHEMIRKDPYTLPDGFFWDTLDLDDARVVSIMRNKRLHRGFTER